MLPKAESSRYCFCLGKSACKPNITAQCTIYWNIAGSFFSYIFVSGIIAYRLFLKLIEKKILQKTIRKVFRIIWKSSVKRFPKCAYSRHYFWLGKTACRPHTTRHVLAHCRQFCLKAVSEVLNSEVNKYHRFFDNSHK